MRALASTVLLLVVACGDKKAPAPNLGPGSQGSAAATTNAGSASPTPLANVAAEATVGDVSDTAPDDATLDDAGIDGSAAAIREAKVVQVVASDSWTCVRRDDGRVRCWGSRFDGKAKPRGSAVPIEIPEMTDAIDIYVTSEYVRIVKADGTLVSTYIAAMDKVPAPNLYSSKASNIARIGSSETVLLRDGTVYRVDKTVEPIPWLEHVKDLREQVALHDDGTLTWFWLFQDKHQKLDAEGITSLIAGNAALRANGSIVGWDNSVNAYRDTKDRTDLPKGTTIMDSSGGTTCALANGAVHCRGRNDHGQLGASTPAKRETFAPVELPAAAVSVVVGDTHVCAILETGALACWGGNRFGQIGDGTLIDRDRPVLIVGATSAVPPPYTDGFDTATGSTTQMSWDKMPNGCKRPTEVGEGRETDVTVVSAYAYAKPGELAITFADFHLRPDGYDYGEIPTRGRQKVLVLALRRGTDKAPIAIDRGRYVSDKEDAPRRVSVATFEGETSRFALHPGISVDLSVLDGKWACGVFTTTDDNDKPVKRPFAARIAKDPW